MELQDKLNKKNLVLFALVSSFMVAYFPVWRDLVSTWYRSSDYSHGFLVIPIFFYLLWQKREKLLRVPVRSYNSGLLLLVLAMIVYVMASYAEIKTVAALTLILSMAGMVLYLYGYKMLREVSFPLFVLLFMIPVPAQIYSALTIPLQLFVSRVSVWFALLLGLPVFREGNVIHLPQRTLEVVQACSGLRSLMAILTLTVVVAYVTMQSNKLKIILMLSGIPAAIVVNIVRVVIIILAYSYFDFDLTRGSIHTIFSAGIFMSAVALIFMVKGVLSIWDKPILER